MSRSPCLYKGAPDSEKQPIHQLPRLTTNQTCGDFLNTPSSCVTACEGKGELREGKAQRDPREMIIPHTSWKQHYSLRRIASWERHPWRWHLTTLNQQWPVLKGWRSPSSWKPKAGATPQRTGTLLPQDTVCFPDPTRLKSMICIIKYLVS